MTKDELIDEAKQFAKNNNLVYRGIIQFYSGEIAVLMSGINCDALFGKFLNSLRVARFTTPEKFGSSVIGSYITL